VRKESGHYHRCPTRANSALLSVGMRFGALNHILRHLRSAELNESYPHDRMSTNQKLVVRVGEAAGTEVLGAFSSGVDKLSRTVRI
jgi:hypothetical protein